VTNAVRREGPIQGTGEAAAARQAGTVRKLRGFVLALFSAGIAGTVADLLLTGHIEDVWQIVPIALLAASAVVVVWLAAGGGAAIVRAHQGVMALFIASGLVGTFLHFRANIEFELEMYPGLSGFDLFWKAIQGASPPSLAPGAMVALGLLGLIYTYRHPALDPNSTDRPGASS
jgi:hypothetical protein